MPRNEEGEFELVLGNKQLLSVFFILVVLLGVFFTMGYIVGRNNPSADAVNIAIARRPVEPASIPKEVDPGPVVASPQPAAVARAAAPAPEERRVSEAPVPEPKKETLKVEEHKVPAVGPVEAPEPAPAAAKAVGGVLAAPPAGSYLQVAAIDQKGAVILADSLHKKRFPTIVTSGPGGLFRVLVGPLASPAEVAQTRTRLEEVGIKGAMARRYKGE